MIQRELTFISLSKDDMGRLIVWLCAYPASGGSKVVASTDCSFDILDYNV
jgi:hypothetical protein